VQNNVPTTTTGTLVLENGLEVTIRVHPETELPPTAGGEQRARVILDIDPGVADVESVGEAIMALLYAGEQMARESRERADRLDTIVRAVAAGRAAQRGEQ